MKKHFLFIMLTALFCICIYFSAHAASKNIPDFCMPILETWNATNEKELQQAILTYWEHNQPIEWETMHKTIKKPVSFQFGGTTKELIRNCKNWDVAIVSSKEVDLQKLMEAGVLIKRGGSPLNDAAFHQWCLPKAVQEKLPQHELYYYAVFCYSYNAETDEAVFLICNEKGRKLHATVTWAWQILSRRNEDSVRALEGICRMYDWERYAMPELTATQEWLLENPKSWDWACLRIRQDDRLEELDRAGLLYDFSQDEYWENRNPSRYPSWTEPIGLFSTDGKIIAIPYAERYYTDSDELSVFVVNTQSEALSQALAYAEHFIKTYEWQEKQRDVPNVDVLKKYNETSMVIFKKDVDW